MLLSVSDVALQHYKLISSNQFSLQAAVLCKLTTLMSWQGLNDSEICRKGSLSENMLFVCGMGWQLTIIFLIHWLIILIMKCQKVVKAVWYNFPQPKEMCSDSLFYSTNSPKIFSLLSYMAKKTTNRCRSSGESVGGGVFLCVRVYFVFA